MSSFLLEPIPEIFEAAAYLNAAANFHLKCNSEEAELLFQKAKIPEIRDWTESIWAAGGIYSEHLKRFGISLRLNSRFAN